MQKYPTMQHHQQQPRQMIGQHFPTHMLQHQMSSSQQENMKHQQLFHQQRSVAMHRNQIQQMDVGNHGCKFMFSVKMYMYRHICIYVYIKSKKYC